MKNKVIVNFFLHVDRDHSTTLGDLRGISTRFPSEGVGKLRQKLDQVKLMKKLTPGQWADWLDKQEEIDASDHHAFAENSIRAITSHGHKDTDYPILTFDLVNDEVLVNSAEPINGILSINPLTDEGINNTKQRLEMYQKLRDEAMPPATCERLTLEATDTEFAKLQAGYYAREVNAPFDLPDAGVNGTGPIVVEQHTRTTQDGKTRPVRKHTRGRKLL